MFGHEGHRHRRPELLSRLAAGARHRGSVSLAAAGAALSLLTGCGGAASSDDAGDSVSRAVEPVASTSASATTSDPPTGVGASGDARVVAALLPTVEALPAGWSTESVPARGGELPAGWTSSSPRCHDLLNQVDTTSDASLLAQAPSQAARFFVDANDTESVTAAAASWDDVATGTTGSTAVDAATALDLIASFPTRCPSWTEEDGHGTTVTTTVTRDAPTAQGRPVDGVTTFTIEVTATGAVKSTSLVDVAAVRVPAGSGITDGAAERVVVVAHATAPGLESPQTTALEVLTSASAGRD